MTITTRYQHIFFDLDHTLWDFDRNSHETLLALFEHYNLSNQLNTDFDLFFKQFQEVNKQLWKAYDLKQIDKKALRDIRFPMIFKHFEQALPDIAKEIDKLYIEQCPKKGHLIEGAIEVLQQLQTTHKLHILTNGFKEIQQAKIAYSGIESYFASMSTSECSGHCKPDKRAFIYALNQANALPENSLMIGDNLENDVLGALNISMNAIHFDSENKQNTTEQKHKTISSLKEIVLYV